LVKLLATIPLLTGGLKPPDPPPAIFFRYASGAGGLQFLYSNDADRLLFRSRVAASFLTLLLALLTFAAEITSTFVTWRAHLDVPRPDPILDI
jgi:hypothetical protein